MDQFCQYPVFFECPRLKTEERKRIENYFQIRRKSCGGDCGPIQTVNDQVYSIAFKDQAAQQRVLQQSEHVLEFPDGPLVLVVRGSLEPRSSSAVTTSPTNQLVGPKLSATTPAQPSQQPILAPNLPQSSAEYELQLDTYLLRYLMDSPRAERELQEDLTSVACTAQLYPEEGRALVRRLQQTGAVVDKQWQAEVDQIFDQVKERYFCHFELDPHKIKVLLLPCSSHKAIGEVMVYSMVGLAIVVGESSQVHARLREVEDLCLQRQGSSVVKKKMTRRLGEAKLRLLWKEIDQSLGGDVPGVKAMRGDAGQLVLEGSVEEIVKAGDWLTEKENLVLQRNVSDFSPHILAFLSKAYEGLGVLCDFLGIDGEVEIEVGTIELRIFALSSDKLDETEKALQGKFKEVRVDVPDCPDVPTELKQKLESKANQMNQGNCRPMVRFVSGGIVRLIGHTEEVEELNEIIIQFIMDQCGIETKVPLPFPELADLLAQLMQLNGCDHSGVTFSPSNTSSSPMVVLSGPSSRVNEVKIKLSLLLSTVVQEKVKIELPAAVRYFQSQQGKEKLLQTVHSHRCVVQLQEHPTKQHWSSREGLCKEGTTFASYCLHSGLQVLICQGDITKVHADALVNAANANLEHGGGVASALSHAGGPQVQKECRIIVRNIGKIAAGEVVVTTGGNLNCKALLHAVGPVAGKAGGSEGFLLEKAAKSSLELAETMEFKSIAIPCISSGVFGVPIKVCVDAIVTAVKKFGSQGDRSLCRVILIDIRGEVVRNMRDACDRLLQGTDTGSSARSGVDAAGRQGEAAADGTIFETQQVFQSAQETVRLKEFTNNANSDQASFYRYVSSSHDEITVMLGGVKLQMVRGDIIHEHTDVIVNTTDFSKNPSGVCKAILTAAGPTVQAELTKVGVPADLMCTTGPGALYCTEIIHSRFNGDVQTIQKHCKNILKQCEKKHYTSIAFPAINTGGAGLNFVKACKAMLDGMEQAITKMKPTILSLIRVVILQQNVFHAFRSELESRFGQVAPGPLTLREKAQHFLKKHTGQLTSNVQHTPDLTSISVLSWKPQPAELSVIGCNTNWLDTIRSVKSDLERILSQMLVEREVGLDDFSRLDEMELEAVQVNVRMLGISLEQRRGQNKESEYRNQRSAGSRGQAGSGVEVYVLKGLKEDVLSVSELLNKALRKCLHSDLQEKEAAMMAFCVQWSLQDPQGAWYELSLHENYVLEQAHQRKIVIAEVEGPNRIKMTINLRAQEATDMATGCTYKVKRNETETGLELPTHWEPMHGEAFQKVVVPQNTQEYQGVAQGFHNTVNQYTIRKIERVQNFYLWQAFKLCKKRIVDKNGLAELGEKMLYHGTSEKSCSCIEKDGFDRSFAGAHGTLHGAGVYFAVEASYSATKFSPRDASGLGRLYVARVLTGRYTVGSPSMRAPPPRAASDPTDRFDSLVDNQQQPSMFVIFHDDQAYPEYLITFS
ncbi:protein mono-ADP-ribosyltransferase PARP14-like isoform X2 [Genypterus blacodes]|uniref:protein mono-ADP-ribosyltransferase PARP14-like isoform X2 n=1 Tax=Genypterus blacodes TaxID=154954 RepID=UPI003F76425A